MDARLSTRFPRVADLLPRSLEEDSALYTRDLAGEATARFTPLHYEAGYRYPLLIWLHGAADNEGQLRRVMPFVSLRNYVAIAPRGTRVSEPAMQGRELYFWGATGDDFSLAVERVFAALEMARSYYNVHNQRVFLAGFGCGGTMALRIGLTYPESFAGLLSLEGSLPRVGRPFARLKATRQLPIFLTSGRQSKDYAAEQVCHDLRLLNSAGLDVSYRQYPCGHDLSTTMLSDMDRWMMERVTLYKQTA